MLAEYSQIVEKYSELFKIILNVFVKASCELQLISKTVLLKYVECTI